MVQRFANKPAVDRLKILPTKYSFTSHIYIYIYLCVCVCVCIYIYLPTPPLGQDMTQG